LILFLAEEHSPVDLPTYTNIWRIEKRLYKLYDFRLPMPLPINWIAVFTGITVPYIVLLIAIGLPFNHTLLWLYILPPGVLTWLTTRPVIESKRLPELVESQARYLTEPRTWVRLVPLSEKDQTVFTARVWRGRQAPQRSGVMVPSAATASMAATVRAGLARDAVAGKGRARVGVPAAAGTATAAAAVAVRERDHGQPPGRAPRPARNTRGAAPGKPMRPKILALGSGGGGRSAPALPAPALPANALPTARTGPLTLPSPPASPPSYPPTPTSSTQPPAVMPGMIEGAPVRVRGGAPGAPHPEVSHDRPGQRPTPARPSAPSATAVPVMNFATTWPAPPRPLRPVRPAPDERSAPDDRVAPEDNAPEDNAPPAPDARPENSKPPEHVAEAVVVEAVPVVEAQPAPTEEPVPVEEAPEPIEPAPVMEEAESTPGREAAESAALVEVAETAEAVSLVQESEPAPVRQVAEPAPVEEEPEPPAVTEAPQPVLVREIFHEEDAPAPVAPVASAPVAHAPVAPPPVGHTPVAPAPFDRARLEHSHEPAPVPALATPSPAPAPAPAFDFAPPQAPAPVPGPAPAVAVNEALDRAVPSVERALSGPSREQNPSWHGKVKIVTGTGASHGPGARDQEALDRNRARLPVQEPKRILVLGCTSGAGQTVTALMVGAMLASLREQPVAAVDLHDGTLARYRAPAAWLDEILAGRPPEPVTQNRPDGLNPTPKPSPARLDVIASHQQLRDGDEIKLAVQLNRHYPLTMLDPGPPGLTKLLKVTDELVVVVPANAEAAGALADTRDWLDNNGYAELAMRSVTVINGVSRRSLPDVEHAESIARGRSRAIVRVPWDDMLPVAATGPSTLRPQTRVAYTALAGVLVAGLAAAGVRKKQ
jgi:MinD-like ATPase involved in chromosome partitioning or flagellar assembly